MLDRMELEDRTISFLLDAATRCPKRTMCFVGGCEWTLGHMCGHHFHVFIACEVQLIGTSSIQGFDKKADLGNHPDVILQLCSSIHDRMKVFASSAKVSLHASSVEQLMCPRCSQVYVPGRKQNFSHTLGCAIEMCDSKCFIGKTLTMHI